MVSAGRSSLREAGDPLPGDGDAGHYLPPSGVAFTRHDLEQIDTFFHASNGRLKLRQFSPNRGELICYHRPDNPGPKQSTYLLVPTDQPAALRDLLAQSLRVLGEVRKRRWLYLVGQTRIHLDEVEGLGTFLEVEVVLRPDQSVQEGEQIADELRRRLEVHEEDLIAVAYLDLLLSRMPHH